MHVRVDDPGGRLALVGRLDAATAGDVRAALHTAVDRGAGDLVVDLSELDLGDATGLGVLVGAHRRAGRSGRRLVLVAVPERVERLLQLTRLHRILYVEVPLPVG